MMMCVYHRLQMPPHRWCFRYDKARVDDDNDDSDDYDGFDDKDDDDDDDEDGDACV